MEKRWVQIAGGRHRETRETERLLRHQRFTFFSPAQPGAYTSSLEEIGRASCRERV